MQEEMFSIEKLSFVVSRKKKKKKILENISHDIKRGQMVAIMGPSGSGKTTLLNVLTLRATYGKSYGAIKLNNRRMTTTDFTKKCFYVRQQDKNWPCLTVEETLTYAAKLYGINKNVLSKSVKDVMVSMGLEQAAETRCSSLSGGQQRRLSLAIALLKNASILFLDEPTSGLDSVSSNKICEVLHNIAKEKKAIVICTIHQPSTKCFDQFDQVMLLSKGRLAYAGDRIQAENYFTSIGHPMQLVHINPAEHYLDLVNSDFGDTDTVMSILEKWENMKQFSVNHANDVVLNNNDNKTENTELESGIVFEFISSEIQEEPESSSYDEFRVVLNRQITLLYRDPVLYTGRSIIFFLGNIFFAIVYWDARSNTQDQALNKIWLIMWFIAVPSMMGVAAVHALHEEICNIHTEMKNGLLQPLSYIISKQILAVPTMLLFGIIALLAPVFGIQTFPHSAMIPFVLEWSLVMLVFESAAECFAVLENEIIGMLSFMVYWVSCFLYAGLFLPPDNIHWPLKLIYHIMPYSYYVRLASNILMSDETFEECNRDINMGSVICIESTKGSDVLVELSKIVAPIEINPDMLINNIIILAMAIFFKALAITAFIYKGKKISIPSPMQNEEEEEMTERERSKVIATMGMVLVLIVVTIGVVTVLVPSISFL